MKSRRLCARIIVSLWNLTGILAALLSTCQSNFRGMRKVLTRISRLRDFTRSYGKTAYRLVSRDLEGYLRTYLDRLNSIVHRHDQRPSLATITQEEAEFNNEPTFNPSSSIHTGFFNCTQCCGCLGLHENPQNTEATWNRKRVNHNMYHRIYGIKIITFHIHCWSLKDTLWFDVN